MKKTLILLGIFLLPLAAFAATSDAYVPLTSLPITNVINTTGDFSSLVNNIYKICIGAAAAIAVFQIMRAGLMYMSAGDNTESISGARKLISNSILGLVLVLSPYIVFGIINPDITNNLGIGGLSSLTNLSSSASTGTGTSGSGTAGSNPGTSQNPTTPTAAPVQFQVSPGSYIYSVGSNSIANPGCITLTQIVAVPNQSTCQADKTAILNSFVEQNKTANPQADANLDLTTYYDCSQTSDGSVTIPSANLCASQPYQPTH